MKETQVIAVDLDGTLTLTDTLHESVLSLLRNKPYLFLLLPFWLFQGIAYFKLKVSEHSELDVTTLPYNQPLIDWLREEKLNGKKIVLSTAANEQVALAVVNSFDLFDEFIASDSKINLKSALKRHALQERYGIKGYDYAGNSSDDIEVWAGASNAILVNAGERILKKVSKLASIKQTFSSGGSGIELWLKALRVHQWIKNLLLFVPLLAAHQLGNIDFLGLLIIAFFSFSLCASSVYIINDLLDLESDRSHPRKKNRPFASAKLPIIAGVAIAPLLIGLSVALGVMVSIEFLIVLLLYFLLTATYSLVLKRLVLVDCVTLATLYTIRIIAGAAAISLSISFWLLAFSIFIFLSLAFVKRYVELLVHAKEAKCFVQGRGYAVSDAPLLQALGVSSGYISAFIIALYIQTEDIISLYTHPIAIWFMLPIILFWISWVWLKATRGEMNDDPIVFAIKDKVSHLVAMLTAVILLYASVGIHING